MVPLFKVIMKYLVVTPISRREFQSAGEAVIGAKEMIMDTIVSCRPTLYWWARVICLTSGISGLIKCPHVGVWHYSGAMLFQEYL